ncbi:MAG: hypothetical protein AAF368_01290, partial [Planctomycetota bacterium]
EVQVVNHENEFVEDVQVQGEILFHHWEDEGLIRSDQTFTFLRKVSAGTAYFQDPMAVTSGLTEHPMRGEGCSWKEFRVHVPGVLEVESASTAQVDVPLNAKTTEISPIRLVMPPVGSLRLEISGPPEERSRLDGIASLRAVAAGRPSGDFFRATISDGEALWPHIAPGTHVAIEVHLTRLGQEWSVEGVAEGLGESPVRTRVPSRPLVKGKFVDEDGMPYVGRSVQAFHGVRNTREMRGDIRFETQADGYFQFAWTNPEEVSGPLHLVLDSAFGEGQWTRGAVAIDLATEDMTRALDLGEIQVSMLSPEPLIGQVVDPAGKALDQVQIRSFGNLGHSWSVMTDDEGRFQMTPVWEDSITLELTDRQQRYPETSIDLHRADLEDPLVITMTNGGRIRGRMRPSKLSSHGEAYAVRIVASGEDEQRSVPFGADGSFDSGALGEGTWSLSIVGAGLAVISEIGEYTSRAGDTLELDLPSMEELFRSVSVVPEAMPKHVRINAVVFNETGSVLSFHYGLPVLIPRKGEWKVRFSAHGRRTTLVEASEIPERYELHLPEALRVRLVSVAPLPSDYDLALRGEPGAENAGQYISFPEPGALGVNIAIPMPGRYRLHRVEKARTDLQDPGLGVQTAAALKLEPTVEVMEVMDVEQLQEIAVDFEAPLLDGE